MSNKANEELFKMMVQKLGRDTLHFPGDSHALFGDIVGHSAIKRDIMNAILCPIYFDEHPGTKVTKPFKCIF